MASNNYRVTNKPLITSNYFGFEIQYRDNFADRYIIRDMFIRDYGRIPSNPRIVIDVGAHIGLFSLAAIQKGAQKIYAFEPEAFNFEVLCHNVKVNNLEKQIVCINQGIGQEGVTKLFIDNNNSGGSSTYLSLNKKLNPDQYQTIKLISIHNLFHLYAIPFCDVLKLDCEGSEKDIIDELDETLVKQIGQISVEIHDRQLVNPLVNKLSHWYKGECTNMGYHKGGNAWVFKKKI